jgi:hypothetical protein
MIPESPTEESARLVLDSLEDDSWLNPCLICGAMPKLRAYIDHWGISCPNFDDDSHRSCYTAPHSVYCSEVYMARDTWNRDHHRGKSLI